MPDKQRFSAFFTYSFFIGAGLGFVSLFFSPFLISLGTVFVLISVLPHIRDVLGQNLKFIIPILILLLFGTLDFIRSDDYLVTLHKWSFLFSFLIISVAGIHYFKNHKLKARMLFSWVVLVVLVVNIHAVANYYSNQAVYDVLLTQGKSIPLINHFHHIHFGIINGIILLVLAYSIIAKAEYKKWYFIIPFILILVSFHVLSSRTGFIALYSSIVVVLGYYGFKHKKYIPMLVGVASMVTMSFIAMSLSSSFNAKVQNSIEDFESWGDEKEINFKSMAMRFEAYKMTTSIIQKNIVFGVGAHKAEQALASEYEIQQSALQPVNRIGPHNQYLEFGLKYGFLGVLVLPFFFLCQIIFSKPITPVFLGVLAILAISLLFESLFERQASVFFMAILLEYSRSITTK